MKTKTIVSALLIAVLLVLGMATPANAVPPLPSTFWGTVLMGESNVPLTTEMQAWINGVMYESAPITLNPSNVTRYTVDVPGDDPETEDIVEGGIQLNTVQFKLHYLDDSHADIVFSQTGVWRTGKLQNVNLTCGPNAVRLTAFQGAATAGDWEQHLPALLFALALGGLGLIMGYQLAAERDLRKRI